MGTNKKSVDEFWKELNQRTAPSRSSLTGISNLPGIQSRSRIVQKPKAHQESSSLADAFVQQLPTGPPRSTSTYDPARAGVSQADLQTYQASIQRSINSLSDADRGVRRRAAEALHAKLFKGDGQTPGASPPMLQALVCGPLFHPLTNLIQDVVERCRSLSLQILHDAARSIQDVEPLMTPIIPQLITRIGTPPVQEPSEEIRLQIICLLGTLVARAPIHALLNLRSELAMLLSASLEDPYHEIKKSAATCLSQLCQRLPPAALEGAAEQLLAALLSSLLHQHSKVRLAILAAMDALVSSGISRDLLQKTLVPGVKPLAHDHAPAVRLALFSAAAHWLGHGFGVPLPALSAAPAPESPSDVALGSQPQLRTLDTHAVVPDILPLLLIGVTDLQAAIGEQVLAMLEGVGEVYTAVSAAGSMAIDVDPSFGPDASLPAGQEPAGIEAGSTGRAAYGAGANTSEAAQSSHMDVEESSLDGGAGSTAGSSSVVGRANGGSSQAMRMDSGRAAEYLWPPFRCRPPEGARCMVQQLLPQLLPPVVLELKEWTAVLRSSAARLLHTVLVLAESTSAVHLPTLLPALTAAVSDTDADVAKRVVACVHALGAHTRPEHWLPLAADGLAAARLSAGQRASALVSLSALLHAASLARRPATAELATQLAVTLSAPDVTAAAVEHPAVQAQLLSAVRSAVAWLGPEAAEPTVSASLYRVLLQLHGHEQDAARQAVVASVLAELAAAARLAGPAELARRHGPAILQDVCANVEEWTAASPNHLTLRALLRTCEEGALRELFPPAAKAIRGVLADADRDTALRLDLLRLVDALMEDDRSASALAGPASASVLSNVLLPPLPWRAGKSAAAVRFAAVTGLCTLLDKGLAPPDVLAAAVASGVLLPLIFQLLEEEWYADVRRSACFAAERLIAAVGGRLTDEQRRAIYPELTKRLDDSANVVRIAACGALQALAASLPPTYCEANAGYLAAAVALHMDDGDATVRDAALGVMLALAAVKPKAVAAEVDKVHPTFRMKQYCNKVLQACGTGRD